MGGPGVDISENTQVRPGALLRRGWEIINVLVPQVPNVYTFSYTDIRDSPGSLLAHLTSQVGAQEMEFSPSQETRSVELEKSPRNHNSTADK